MSQILPIQLRTSETKEAFRIFIQWVFHKIYTVITWRLWNFYRQFHILFNKIIWIVMSLWSSILILDYRLNRMYFCSDDTFNKYRKESTTQQSLRTPCQGVYGKLCCRGLSSHVWNLIAPSVQIFAGGTTNWAPHSCCRANHPYHTQNPRRGCYKAPRLLKNEQYDDGGYRRTCHFNIPCRRRVLWLMILRKIMRFFWSLFLIVFWKQSLREHMMFLPLLLPVVLTTLLE